MSRKLLTATFGLFVLAIVAGMLFVSVSSAAPRPAHTAAQSKPSGLTSWGIANARQSGMPSHLVTMAPQTSLKLLSHAVEIGPHAVQAKIRLIIGLKLRHKAKLQSFLEQVQNPHSAAYHQWLTPSEFTARYGPTKTDVAQVVAFLKAHGITVKSVSQNRILIHTVATTAVYDHAFGIEINDYKLDGRSFFSTTSRPKIPREIAPLISGIIGLNRGVKVRSHSFFKPVGEATRDLSPHAAPPASLTNLSPLQIAHAYDWPDITDADNGAGATIGIVTAASMNVAASDYTTFWDSYGLPEHSVTLVPVDGGGRSATGPIGETLLDIEYSSAMAPGAALRVYVANIGDGSLGGQLGGLSDAFNQLVEENKVDVMTTSWGWCASGYPGGVVGTDEEILAQGAAQGISMFAAAGDSGASDGCPAGNPNNNADYPSSSAYVTAANGTQLDISDLDGTYAFESAWNDANCFGQGPAATGGGISSVIAKPAWQTGPGVPTDVDMRMNSGVALTASCGHPMYTYQFGQWTLTAGTSAVAPMLAGLFANAVSERGGRLGQSNSLIYNDVNANSSNYGTDFHDVKFGCNGYLPDGTEPSCAGTNWDHPTGWGSVKATSLLAHIGIQGNKGTLSGTVTDAATGDPVAGAQIFAVASDGSKYRARTDSDGTYSRVLPAGSLTVTVTDYGYASDTSTVTITDGDTTTQDFALQIASKVKLQGKVTDGSGHSYPLYADIKVSVEGGVGQVADVWTDPKTGKYSVKLPKGVTYKINVAAAFDGYNTASTNVSLSAAKTKNFALTIADTCSAPGYAFETGGFGEDFNGAVFPPDGWTITNLASGPIVWELSSFANQTGGTGTAAIVNTANYPTGPDGFQAFDTSLVTPPISVTALHGAAVILKYKAYYAGRLEPGTNPPLPLDLDITTDGGNTWNTILHWTTEVGTGTPPGAQENVDLGPYLPSGGNFQLRWRFYGPSSHFSPTVQIDDVVIGNCKLVPGGLVMGQVTDANTGKPIVGAHVADENGTGSDTVENHADSNLPVGFYSFFDAAGAHTLTASARHYSPQTAQITLNNNGVVTRNFSLKSARFGVNPGGFTLHVMVNGSATASFALSDSGGAAGRFGIIGINAPPPTTARTSAAGMGAPLIRVPAANRAWAKASAPWIKAQAKLHSKPKAFRSQPAASFSPHAGTAASAWQAIADYPVTIADNTAARDPVTGKVYSMGGFTQQGPVSGPYEPWAYVYDPGTDSWSQIADAPVARGLAVSAFINGKYYVVNGWAATIAGDPVAELDIYDPTTGTWSTGTPNPVPAAGGSAYAVLNGLLYIVGGCKNGACATPTSAVQVYHPFSGSWSSAANYPHPVTAASCGAINGKLYCAGGVATTGAVGDAYVYDPSSNSWSPITDMFFTLDGSFYTAANGLLVVAGGFDGGGGLINAVEAYDPQTDSWIPLPNMPAVAARGGHACGLYQVGGIASTSPFFGNVGTKQSTLLPGYAPCNMAPSIPWLTPAPASGTVAAGASAKITLAFDGAGQQAFTTSSAYLSIANDSPYGALTVPVTVHWEPQPVDLMMTGKASPKSVHKGGSITYSLKVQNRKAAGYGRATQTMLNYPLPGGVSYVASSGDAVCTAPGAGSSPAPAAATGAQPDMITCDFGTLAQGASKTLTIAVQANQAGKLRSHFEVSSREPDDSGRNTLDLTTTVIGEADLSTSAENATLTQGSAGTLQVTVANGGPDAATEVKLKLSAGAAVKLQSAQAGQGQCVLSGSDIECDLGEVAAGGQAAVKVSALGTGVGSAQVTAQATTTADDGDAGNNVATATVTVKAASSGGGNNNGGGGGALGWLALAALLGLALAGAGATRVRKG